MDFYQVLLNQFRYTHKPYFNSFGNFRVFSIQLYQLYAYPIFWAWVEGSFFGHTFHPKFQMLPPTLEKLKWLEIWVSMLAAATQC